MAALSEKLKPAPEEPEESLENDAGGAEAPEISASESSEDSESEEVEESGEDEELEESGSSSEESDVSGGDSGFSESTVSSGDPVSSGDTSSGNVVTPGSALYSDTDNPELTELFVSFQETQSLLLESSQRIESQLEAVISIFLIILVVGLLHYIYRFFKLFF